MVPPPGVLRVICFSGTTTVGVVPARKEEFPRRPDSGTETAFSGMHRCAASTPLLALTVGADDQKTKDGKPKDGSKADNQDSKQKEKANKDRARGRGSWASLRSSSVWGTDLGVLAALKLARPQRRRRRKPDYDQCSDPEIETMWDCWLSSCRRNGVVKACIWISEFEDPEFGQCWCEFDIPLPRHVSFHWDADSPR